VSQVGSISAAIGPGGGGGGGVNYSGLGATRAGGDGVDGIVIVKSYT
jgi:hypothetical protein